MKILLLLILHAVPGFLLAQSIHEIELAQHPDSTYVFIPSKNKVQREKTNCNLNKTVFGWHPYWMNGAEANYQWDLLSDLCFFAYEVDPSTGNATSTHGFATNNAVTSALANGTNVHLCATLFSSHATFFASSTAQNTLITNLISLIQSRGAHGINIDFEGVPSSQSANLTAFMINLSNQLHAANSSYKLSICLYAVDWSNVFDEATLNNYVDFYTIMGYDYYYSGSAQAGPNDPLYGFTSGYDYSLSRSISYYLNAGIPTNKLVLGLPYYGREWETTSSTVPGTTTGNNVYSRTYSYVKNNGTGFYTNPGYDTRSASKNYIFQNSGTWRQCWISEGNEMQARMETVVRRNLKGIGIWALGYDDGYSEMWQAIDDELTDCRVWNCTDTLYDEGGPLGSYYNNENFTYTVAPPGATEIQVNFLEFSTESGFDTLFLYDGNSTNSPLIGFYHGTAGPGTFTTNSGQLTLRFKSDGSTRDTGWKMAYSCISDNTAPVTMSSFVNSWLTENDTCTFVDSDNLAVAETFWNASTLDANEWTGNLNLGHVHEPFATSSNWNLISGVWNTTGGFSHQTDETNSNTNLALPYTLDTASAYLFEWQSKISGSGSNRRAGLHYMCSDLSLSNRGNSYFIYLRVDSDVIQWYKVTNDVFSLVHSENFTLEPDSSYNVKVIFSKITGEHAVYIDNAYVGSWTDSAPLSQSQGLSLRSGNCMFDVDFVKVYNSRSAEMLTRVGVNGHFFNCNPDPSTSAGKIESVCVDISHLIGSDSDLYDVDFTPPVLNLPTEENPDVDTLLNTMNLLLENLNAADTNSDLAVKKAWVFKANTGDTVLTLSTVSTSSLLANLSGLENDTLYRIGFLAVNNAGLADTVFSDGFIYLNNLGLTENSGETIRIYPNPARDYVVVEMNKEQTISILDTQGQLIRTLKAHVQETIDISDLASGTYYLVFGKTIAKLVKM